MFLVNSRQGHFSATSFGFQVKPFYLLKAIHIANLRMYFAEFLNRDYLERLWILTSLTCVGLRYGHLSNSFSSYFSAARILSILLTKSSSPIRYFMYKDLPHTSPTGLNAHAIRTLRFTFCVTTSVKRFISGTGILTSFPSATPFGLTLGSD